MVISKRQSQKQTFAIVTIELVIAIALLVTGLLPLAYSFVQEQRAARALYFRAIAMEIVDGEMERLIAGQWQAFSTGRHSIRPRASAAANLPSGEFLLSVSTQELRLEWRPAKRGSGGTVTRTAPVPPAQITRRFE